MWSFPAPRGVEGPARPTLLQKRAFYGRKAPRYFNEVRFDPQEVQKTAEEVILQEHLKVIGRFNKYS